MDFLCENLIHHVDKVDNPANLHEVRPRKDFWSILKAKVYENNWEAKTLHQLEVRIKKRSGLSYNIENNCVCEKKT